MDQNRQLSQVEIVPQARPIQSFVGPANPSRTPGPAEPRSVVGSNRGFARIETGSAGNVQGYYQNDNEQRRAAARAAEASQLAEALGPFTQNALSLFNKSAELWVSDQYQKGQNDALEAAMRTQRQMEVGAKEYAAENRALSQVNPMAAMAMDRVNPYRASGRQAGIAAAMRSALPTLTKAFYRENAGRLADYDGNSPELLDFKAQLFDSIRSLYGLDYYDPAFMASVLPVLNEQWDRISEMHLQDRAAVFKATEPAMIAGQLRLILQDGQQRGTPIEEQRLQIRMLLDDKRSTYGLAGEADVVLQQGVREALQQALMEGNAEEVLELTALGAEVGLSLDDMAGDVSRIDGRQQQQIEREQQRLSDEFRNELTVALSGVTDPMEQRAIRDQFLADERWSGIPEWQRLDLVNGLVGAVTTAQQQGMSQVAGEIITEMEAGIRDATDQEWMEEGEARVQQFQQQIDAMPAGPAKIQAQQRLNDLKRARDEALSSGDADVNGVVNEQLALLRSQLAESAAAQAQGQPVDLLERLREGKQSGAGLTTEERRVLLQWERRARNAALAALRQAEAANGGPLEYTAKMAVIEEAVGKLAPPTFPKAEAPAAPAPGGPAPGGPAPTKPAQGRFTASTLREVPNDALGNWNRQPLLTPTASAELVRQLAMPNNRGTFSPFPRSLVDAAARVGVNPGTFLVRQAELNGIDIDPRIKRVLEREGGKVMRGERASAAAVGGGPDETLAAVLPGVMSETVTVAEGPDGEPSYQRFMPRTTEFLPVASTAVSIPVVPVQGQATPAQVVATGPRMQVVSHPDTGRGLTYPGLFDGLGRPLVLGAPALRTVPAMVRDSGGQFRTADVNSAQRSRAKNASLGGAAAPNSGHLYGEKLDVQGTTYAWLRQHGHKYGWRWVYDMAPGVGDFEYVGPGARSELARPDDTAQTVQLVDGTVAEGTGDPGGGPIVASGFSVTPYSGPSVTVTRLPQVRLFVRDPDTGLIARPTGMRRGAAIKLGLDPDSLGSAQVSYGSFPSYGSVSIAAAPGAAVGAAGGASALPSDNASRFLTGVKFLETNGGQKVGNGGGPFQFVPDTVRWIMRQKLPGVTAEGLLAGDLAMVAKVFEWYSPDGWAAVQRGDWETAIQKFNPMWVSLPGGSQATQLKERYDRFYQILAGG